MGTNKNPFKDTRKLTLSQADGRRHVALSKMKVGQEQGFPFSKCVNTEDKPETFGCDCDVWKITLPWSKHLGTANGLEVLHSNTWSTTLLDQSHARIKCCVSGDLEFRLGCRQHFSMPPNSSKFFQQLDMKPKAPEMPAVLATT